MTDLASETVTIAVPGAAAPMGAYVVRPVATGRRRAVIVCGEIFGVTDHIKDIAGRVASSGYIALCPDFYHRTAPGAALGYDPDGRNTGMALMRRLQRAEVLADVGAAIAWLKGLENFTGAVGLLGFSLGSHIVYLAATEHGCGACAGFYGGWICGTEIALSQPEPTLSLTPKMRGKCGQMLMFFGSLDPLIPADERAKIDEALSAAQVPHEVVTYEGAKHGFFCDVRDSFDKGSRDDAWWRVLEMFRKQL